MRKITLYILTTLLLCGCAHYSAYDNFLRNTELRKEFASKHDELSPEIKQAIIDGKIVPGMDQSLIRTLFGDPDETYLSETGMFEMWYYENFAFGFDKNGKVIKVFNPEDMKFEKKKPRR
ncbi:MAG TPA: hypothetical protein P5065_00695 [Candidatus Ratteibacteria bacterium]|jgi:hypothetical protein|uniref:SmpA / OmlA family protein n=1 Tax=candidate division TA06 bacterium ADurb.Bin131 TaxID=1852827 RepID=A0A1V6CAK7_UNCT6|nr:MAG: hypothetical protein BWX89_00726 [candidate division TA06 bacterium ADurb.Bin131]HOC02376.1 hypothetical protein [bacterium]HRS05547.1 hypothetical protein [Candidatus Ratteibacteria bacterium]HON06376.1 hypothetical protein [bacterium]HOQ81566.1 hypothetical protein [bacterium]